VPKYGLIIEGPYDTPVFKALILRLNEPDAEFFPIEAQGKSQLVKRLPIYLHALETAFLGQPADRAFVIQDSDRRAPADVIAQMKASIGTRKFKFIYDLCVAVRETETWLLSDEGAISAAAKRQGGRTIGYLPGNLEQLFDAKEKLISRLTQARLPYTPQTCGEIAELTDLATLRYRCPSFKAFADLF
jgi:hypothetical protein